MNSEESTTTVPFKTNDKVTIGGGKAVYSVLHVWSDGTVRVGRTIGVGRLGRNGRFTSVLLGKDQKRPLSDLHLVEAAPIPTAPEAGDHVIIRIPGWQNVSGTVADVGAATVKVVWLTGDEGFVALDRFTYFEGTGWVVDAK